MCWRKMGERHSGRLSQRIVHPLRSLPTRRLRRFRDAANALPTAWALRVDAAARPLSTPSSTVISASALDDRPEEWCAGSPESWTRAAAARIRVLVHVQPGTTPDWPSVRNVCGVNYALRQMNLLDGRPGRTREDTLCWARGVFMVGRPVS